MGEIELRADQTHHIVKWMREGIDAGRFTTADDVLKGLAAEAHAFDVALGTHDVKQYLDDAIVLWRDIRDGRTPAPPERQKMAEAYIDAFQSVRLTAFGELLPEPDLGDPTRIPDSPGPNNPDLDAADA